MASPTTIGVTTQAASTPNATTGGTRNGWRSSANVRRMRCTYASLGAQTASPLRESPPFEMATGLKWIEQQHAPADQLAEQAGDRRDVRALQHQAAQPIVDRHELTERRVLGLRRLERESQPIYFEARDIQVGTHRRGRHRPLGRRRRSGWRAPRRHEPIASIARVISTADPLADETTTPWT